MGRADRGGQGVYVLHDGVAVVAGSADFVTRVYADLRTMVDQVAGIVREIRSMKAEYSERWALGLLNDVLGARIASEMWEQTA